MSVKKLIVNIKNLDKKIVSIMKNGIKVSFIFCLIACLILITYSMNSNPNVFYIGINLFKSSLFYMVTCIICGFVFNKIKEDLL